MKRAEWVGQSGCVDMYMKVRERLSDVTTIKKDMQMCKYLL